MPLPIGFSYGTSALSSSYAAIALTADTSNEANSKKVPARCLIDKVRVAINTISSAASLTWYLAEDSAGKYALTPVQTSTIDTGISGSTFGFIAASTDGFPYLQSSNITTDGTIYMVVKTDADTPTAEVFIHWRQA